MNKVSKLFNNRSKNYNKIYTQVNPKRLLHQEKRLRAEVTEDLVLSLLDASKKEIVVDVGCGMGNLLANIKSRGISAELHGYDISYEMISLAEENKQEGINFELGSIEDIHFKANIVTSLGVAGYQDDQIQFIENLSNIVDKEGFLIFSVANGDSFLRGLRRLLSKLHSLIVRRSKGVEFLALKEKQVEYALINNGFNLEKKIYTAYGLGLFSSSIECFIDRLLFKYFKYKNISKYLSLSVIYVYKKISK